MSHPAQIVFVEDDRGGRWRGRLLNRVACIDTQHHDRSVGGTSRFDIEEGRDGRFYATMQGRDKGGRRYRRYDTLDAAQKAAIRWAGRRFRIPVA